LRHSPLADRRGPWADLARLPWLLVVADADLGRLLGRRLQSFGEARIHVVDAGEIVDPRSQLQGDGEAADDVARSARDDVDAEHPTARSVEDDLVETVLRTEVLRACDRAQREIGRAHV